ncbi:unnamed protein product, partial [Oikopleura dioica]
CTIVSIPCLIYDTLVSSLQNGNNAAIRDYTETLDEFGDDFGQLQNVSVSDNAGKLALFAIESLANILEKFEDNTALDGVARTPLKFISQFDSILSVWGLFTSLESLDDLKQDEFITLAIAVVDFGASFLIDENIEDFVQYEVVPFLRKLQDQATEFDVKSIFEASADLLLNNNMANLIGLNLNLKKFKSTVTDAIFNVYDDMTELAAVGLFNEEKSVELAGKVSIEAAEIYMDTVAWIAESGTSLTVNNTKEAAFLSAFGKATRRALWPVVTLTFSLNIAVAEGAREIGENTEKIFEHLDELLKTFEGPECKNDFCVALKEFIFEDYRSSLDAESLLERANLIIGDALFELLQIPINSVNDAVNTLVQPLSKMLKYFVHVSSEAPGRLEIFSETYESLLRQIEVKEYLTDSVVNILDSLAKLLPEAARDETKEIARWTRLANIAFSLEIYFYGSLVDSSLPSQYKLDNQLLEISKVFLNETTTETLAEYFTNMIEHLPLEMQSVEDLQKWAINKSAGFLTALDKILSSITEEKTTPAMETIESLLYFASISVQSIVGVFESINGIQKLNLLLQK